MWTRLIAPVAVLAAALMATAVPAGANAAVEDDHPTSTTMPSDRSWECVETVRFRGCFADYGEWFYLWDKMEDGVSPVIAWEVWHWDGGTDREGLIWHLGGAFTRRLKNKSFDEDRTVMFYICGGDHSTHRVYWSNTCSEAKWTKS